MDLVAALAAAEVEVASELAPELAPDVPSWLVPSGQIVVYLAWDMAVAVVAV